MDINFIIHRLIYHLVYTKVLYYQKMFLRNVAIVQ